MLLPNLLFPLFAVLRAAGHVLCIDNTRVGSSGDRSKITAEQPVCVRSGSTGVDGTADSRGVHETTSFLYDLSGRAAGLRLQNMAVGLGCHVVSRAGSTPGCRCWSKQHEHTGSTAGHGQSSEHCYRQVVLERKLLRAWMCLAASTIASSDDWPVSRVCREQRCGQ